MQRPAWSRFSVKRLAVVAVAAGVLAWLIPPIDRFGYSSVCDRCGKHQSVRGWRTPLTYATLFQRTTERDTPLSKWLTQTGIVPSHTHRWSGAHHNVVAYVNAESDDVVKLVEAAHRFGEIELRDKLLRGTFDPEYSRTVQLLTTLMPPEGFADADAFHAWMAEESWIIKNMLPQSPPGR